MNEHPMKDVFDNLLSKIKELVSSDTIIGEAIVAPDGMRIIPVSKAVFGFASGGTEFDSKRQQNVSHFGGGSGADYALAGYRLKNTFSKNGGVSRGVCSFDSDMFMTDVREYTDLKLCGAGVSSAEGAAFAGDELVSLNFWAFRREFMDLLAGYFEDFIKENINEAKKEFYLPFAVNKAVNEGRARVRVVPVDEVWQGVTYKEDKSVVEDFLLRNRRGFSL